MELKVERAVLSPREVSFFGMEDLVWGDGITSGFFIKSCLALELLTLELRTG